jgi:hypothetical protein
MFKKTRRNKPAVGTVISIPIAGGQFAYAINVYASRWWIFDFKTSKRTNDLGLFDSSRWLKFIGIVNGIGADTIDECVAVLGPLEANIPPTWTRVPQWVVDSGRAATQYRVTQFKPGNFEVPFWYVSEEEPATMQESISLE